MADKKTLEQMLEHLVNDEQQKAEELFHEYVVTKSREIYESLIEAEMKDEEDEEEVEEASDESKEEDEEDLDEEFEDVALEADDEMDLDKGDPTDSLAGEIGDEEGGEESEEEMMQDLASIIDELQDKFNALQGAEEKQGEFGDMGDEESMKDDFELETVREYVEKVPAGHGAEKKGQAEKADGSATGLKFSKNDMGGTSANILSGRNGADGGEAGSPGGQLKGNGLTKGKAQDMKTGNINVPGGNAGKTGFTHKEPGHGAEKKGAGEGPTDGTSLFRGSR